MSAVDHLKNQIATLRSPTADLSDLKVSKRSYVHDLIWDFGDDLVHRPRTICDSKLRVDWGKWQFSPSLRRELQRIYALYYKAPSVLSRRGKELKPNSLVTTVKRSLDFLEKALGASPSMELIDSLEQVALTDLHHAANEHRSARSNIKRGLRILFHPSAERALGKTFKVTQGDIKALPIRNVGRKSPEKRLKEIEGPAFFCDDLFALLSDEATARVNDFLRRLGEKTGDSASYAYEAPPGIPQAPEFGEAFTICEQLRRAWKCLPNDRVAPIKQLRLRYKEIIPPKLLQQYLSEVNTAAQCVIGLYVGPRFSELASFEVGCLTERDGIPCIIGRNFKGKRDKNFTDDAWVAIPAVRDAVRALEKLAHLKNNKYLFSAMKTAGGKSYGNKSVRNADLPYSSTGFNNAMNRFIRIVDKEGLFSDWKFTSHQFKHSITRQLIKAKLGLAYISFHLKHLHKRIAMLPSEVTLGYGNAGKIFQSKMAGYQIEEVKRELARKIFDPDYPVYGGGAAEFDARRKSYFKGMTDSGMSKEQIIDELASLGESAFVNVGLGFCLGRKHDKETGEKPPCIGSLRCNPNKCSNAIITKDVHGPAWQRIAFENRKMGEDPRFAYAKDQFEAAAKEAEEVCRYLGMDIDNG